MIYSLDLLLSLFGTSLLFHDVRHLIFMDKFQVDEWYKWSFNHQTTSWKYVNRYFVSFEDGNAFLIMIQNPEGKIFMYD